MNFTEVSGLIFWPHFSFWIKEAPSGLLSWVAHGRLGCPMWHEGMARCLGVGEEIGTINLSFACYWLWTCINKPFPSEKGMACPWRLFFCLNFFWKGSLD